jgi:uncharacterized OsmC-like protein
MNAEQLKQIQTPIKEQYKEKPDSAMITLKAMGKVGEGISCKIDTGKALVQAGLHPATGGTGQLACSGDMLLEALAACAGVTLKAVATAIGVNVDNASVIVEGDLDFRGTLGVSKDAPVGFKAIRLIFIVANDVTAEQIQTLTKLTERYCVVYQTLTKGVSIETRFQS